MTVKKKLFKIDKNKQKGLFCLFFLPNKTEQSLVQCIITESSLKKNWTIFIMYQYSKLKMH